MIYCDCYIKRSQRNRFETKRVFATCGVNVILNDICNGCDNLLCVGPAYKEEPDFVITGARTSAVTVITTMLHMFSTKLLCLSVISNYHFSWDDTIQNGRRESAITCGTSNDTNRQSNPIYNGNLELIELMLYWSILAWVMWSACIVQPMMGGSQHKTFKHYWHVCHWLWKGVMVYILPCWNQEITFFLFYVFIRHYKP